jgi:hypothetical protein
MFQCSGFLAHRREELWRPRKILQERTGAAFFKNRRNFSGSYRFQRNKRTLHTLYFLSLSTKLNNTNKNSDLHPAHLRRPRPPIVVFRPFQKTTFGTSNKNNHLAKIPKSPRCWKSASMRPAYTFKPSRPIGVRVWRTSKPI